MDYIANCVFMVKLGELEIVTMLLQKGMNISIIGCIAAP